MTESGRPFTDRSQSGHLPANDMVRVLYVEDDELEARSISRHLRRYGFVVDTAKNAREALELSDQGRYDVVLLDFMLNDTLNGPEVCHALRERGSSAGVMMLTGLSELDSKLVAFQAGAQDYLTKPYEFAELIARLHALAERSPVAAEPPRPPADVPTVRLEQDGYWLRIGDERVELTRTEYSMLLTLERAHGQTVSTADLCRAVWGNGRSRRQSSLYVHVNNLRSKLEPHHEWRLQTVKGLGYRFDIGPTAPEPKEAGDAPDSPRS
jgi:DNA-binding response OmpR family regulator